MQQEKAAGRRLPLLQILRLIGLGFRWLPALLVRSLVAHRQFSRTFVQEATQHGLPVELAQEIAESMGPRDLMKGTRP